MRRLLPIVAAFIVVLMVAVTIRAGSTTSPNVRPGECAQNIQYTQRFQFMPTAFDTNEYLKFITEYEGCDVIISEGHEEGTNRDGFFIWYKLPPLAGR